MIHPPSDDNNDANGALLALPKLVLANALLRLLCALRPLLLSVSERWDQRVSASCMLQRAMLRAAFDAREACAALRYALTGSDSPALGDPTALPHLEEPEQDDETLLDADLRAATSEAMTIHTLARALQRALRAKEPGADPPLPPSLVLLLTAAAAQVYGPARAVMDLCIPGAREADKHDAVQVAFAQALEQRRVTLTERLIYAAVPPGAAPPSAWSLLGWSSADDRPVALPADRGQVVLACGVPGSGKSQAALTQIEAALRPRPCLTAQRMLPTAVASFHTDLSGVTLPELLWSVLPNPRRDDAAVLSERLGALCEPLPSVRLAVPEWLLPEYRERVRTALGCPAGLELVPLRLPLGQLGARGLEAQLGALGTEADADYLQRILQDAEALGDDLTLASWRRLIEARTGMNGGLRQQALSRIAPLERIEAPPGSTAARRSGGIWALCQPGTLTVFALGGRWLPQRAALPLVTALMNAVSQPGGPHGLFQRFFHLDEVSRLKGDPRLWSHLVMTARQQRHWAAILWLLGQDLMDLPDELLALAPIALLFRQGSPRVLEHLRQRLPSLWRLRFQSLAHLQPGHAMLLCSDFSDARLRGRLPVYVRPPRAAHGGHSVSVA